MNLIDFLNMMDLEEDKLNFANKISLMKNKH